MTMASPMPPFIAAATQRRRQLLLQHRLDEAADAAAQTGLDRVEPSLTRKQPLGARRCRAILVHGVVSPGASTPGFGCRVSTGDYVTPFPTTSRTGPHDASGHECLDSVTRGLRALRPASWLPARVSLFGGGLRASGSGPAPGQSCVVLRKRSTGRPW